VFYFAKIIEALGIVVVAVNFILAFPELMNFRIFLAGSFLFMTGWIIERYWVKSR
jgi:hypothetical protein